MKEIFLWLKFAVFIMVSTIKLPNILTGEKIEWIDFVHLDIQVAELLVLEGAGNDINKIKMVWMEVENIPLYKNQPLKNEVEHFIN